MTDETAHAREMNDASVIRGSGQTEVAEAHGHYVFECVGTDGKIKWREVVDNIVCNVGKNLMLDTALAGSGYSVTGPFMGLISSVSYTAVAATDTMASHTGWLEAGGATAPTYTGNRKTAAWSASTGGAKSLSAALAYAITGTGTVKGAFLVFGSGAVGTKDDANGVLWSAGVFTTGDKAVVNVRYVECQLLDVAMSDGRAS